MREQSDFVFIGQQTVTAAVPLILAGVGELVAETAGVINIGIEGLMLMGCIAAYVGAGRYEAGWVGVVWGGAAGMVLAGIFAAVTVWMRADQIVAGTAVNLVAIGVSTTVGEFVSRAMPELPVKGWIKTAPIHGLASWPVAGPIFFQQYALCYVLACLVVVVGVVMRWMRGGLILRALGDGPDACDAAGIRVRWWRTGSVLFAGACAGVAGSYLSIMRTHEFAPEMTGGQGFLVLALVIFGRWRVWGLVLGCLMFGAVDSLQQFMQASAPVKHFLELHLGVEEVPFQLFKMLPYLAALGALAVMARGGNGPVYLGRPWPEEGK